MILAVSVGDSFQQTLDSFFAFLPKLIGALLVLLIAFIIAKVVKKAVTALLQKLDVDQKLKDSPAGSSVDKVTPDSGPSGLIGTIAFWFIFLFGIVVALTTLGISGVNEFLGSITSYLPNIVAALLIFVVAALLAGLVVGAVERTMGDTPLGKLVETVVPGLIMAIAVFMILTQLGIAPSIVQITYTALLAFLVLAGGLAFGLGGREVAAELLGNAYDKGREQTDQAKQDLQKGRDRAKEQGQQAKGKAKQKAGEQSDSDDGSDRQDSGQHTETRRTERVSSTSRPVRATLPDDEYRSR